ncbi:MAG TPA: response regulator transcription factor, partial [Thermoanaerobaculia bacterium]|nr:response regulator transcription factor [Thermoanaerobaculia bacterium]
MRIRILLADDHLMVRQGIRAVLEREGFDVVAEAMDGREAVKLAGRLKPDVAVLDIAMPLLNGIDAAREIRRVSPRTKTTLLTVHEENQYVVEALRAGVTGYVVKTKAADDLVKAIREVSLGAVYMSPGVSREAVRAYLDGTDPSIDGLTPREREVLQLVAEGKTTKEVAAVLGISVKTAESHRSRIMAKLDIHETA